METYECFREFSNRIEESVVDILLWIIGLLMGLAALVFLGLQFWFHLIDKNERSEERR